MSDLDELYDELSDFHAPEKAGSSRSPREERIIAGFEDIERFYEHYGRLPAHGENNDIFERLYAVRLDKIRSDDECQAILIGLDKYGLLQGPLKSTTQSPKDLDDDELLAELGALKSDGNDITKLTHVRSRAEVKAAEEIATRKACEDFEKFRPLFETVQHELKTGAREAKLLTKNAQISQGDFFILNGQKVYVAEISNQRIYGFDGNDYRLRVIYDNGTESDLLLRSLQRALDKDDAGRRIIESAAGPLFSDILDGDDLSSGTIYVLRSRSDNPVIAKNREIIHKIGVTGGKVEKRITSANLDPTYLMADVDVVATYELYNINRAKLEHLIHRFFDKARLDIKINDRFGNPVVPKEWYLVPIFVIDEVVEKIKDGSIDKYQYDPDLAKITKA